MCRVSKLMAAPAFVAAALAAHGQVKTATPFADNMVLQRGRAVPVWGAADPGEKVVVEFAGQTKTVQAGSDGKWRVDLDAMETSRENRTLVVTGASNSETIKNVLVGEVWFASGQSNTECPIWGPNPRYRDGQGAMMTAAARRPCIRYVKNERLATQEPRLGWKAVWRDYSPESFKETFKGNLSAIAFYYAVELHDAIGVPVGILDSSWGGTRIEPWTPPSGFARPPKKQGKTGAGTPSALWNGMVAAFAPYAIKGFIWYQGCANAGDGRSYCAKMHNLYDGWAKEFENPGLKLYFVQLAPFSRSWFEIQLGQSQFAKEEKNAAMVTTCDVGNLWDIHPNDKETVARRLVLHALKRDYGFAGITDDPPELESWKVEGGKFVMSFKNAGSWYVYNADRSPARGFEIAGKDGRFVAANIENKGDRGTLSGKELVVSAPGVAHPRRLRYLYSKPWTGSLYSFDSGLPLGPFEIRANGPADEYGADPRSDPRAFGSAGPFDGMKRDVFEGGVFVRRHGFRREILARRVRPRARAHGRHRGVGRGGDGRVLAGSRKARRAGRKQSVLPAADRGARGAFQRKEREGRPVPRGRNSGILQFELRTRRQSRGRARIRQSVRLQRHSVGPRAWLRVHAGAQREDRRDGVCVQQIPLRPT